MKGGCGRNPASPRTGGGGCQCFHVKHHQGKRKEKNSKGGQRSAEGTLVIKLAGLWVTKGVSQKEVEEFHHP